MIKLEVENGFIEYRLPNPEEALMLMHHCDLGAEGQSLYLMASKVMKHLSPFIVKVEIKKDEEMIDSYEKLSKELYYLNDLLNIVGRILEAIMGGVTAKKKS